MADFKISTFIYAGLLGLFLFLGINGFMLDLSSGYDVEGIEDIQEEMEILETQAKVYNEKGETLKGETVNLASDSDANDVEGNFIVKGWEGSRDSYTGDEDDFEQNEGFFSSVTNSFARSTNLVSASKTLLIRSIEKINLPPFVAIIVGSAFVIGLFIVGIRISVERRGT